MTRVGCLGECMVELRERADGLLERGFGGDTLNTAVYLARLGVAVDYVTALGTDPFSDDMLAAWAREGVGTSHVQRVPGRLPGLYLIQTDPKGERRFSHWREAAPVRDLFRLPATAAAVEAGLAGFDLVYLSGITLSLFSVADRERLFGVLDALRARGGRVAFDSNFRPRGWPDRAVAAATYAAMLARSDIAFVSGEDVALITGGAGASDDVTHFLGETPPGEVVLRFPDLDCRVLAGGASTAVPATPVARVVDTTAAGDSFAAGYLAARLAGAAPAEAAGAGHRLAACVVQHPGAIIPADAMPPRVS